MYRYLFLLAYLLFPVLIALGSPNDSLYRPKLGLVLSGGGAKGVAHIGVLRVLEDAGLRPDYISGTSMGAIIGGLYAIGYSADELSELNSSMNWNELLTNEVPLYNVVMEEKYDYQRYMVEFPLIRNKVVIPSGLIMGQQVSQLFSKLSWPVAGIDDFNEFPVPFVCLGTDLIGGKSVEFRSGDLPTAMRSSMAIPSLFSPVLMDTSKLIVDGGVLRNFPVDEVIEMGADIVIGVNVGFTDEVTPESLRSMPELLARTASFYGAFDTEMQKEKVDLLIQPDLSDYSMTSFNNTSEIEEIGRNAALELKDQLQSIADTLNLYEVKQDTVKYRKMDSIFIVQILVENTKYTSPEFVQRKSGIEPGTRVTAGDMDRAIDRVFGTLNYDKISYKFSKTDYGYQLIFDVQEKPQTYLKSSVHYDNYYDAGLILNYTGKNLFFPGTKFIAEADISKYPQFKLYFHKYMGPLQKLVGYFESITRYNRLPLYKDRNPVGYYNQTHFNIAAGSVFSSDINQQAGFSLNYEISTVQPNHVLKEIFTDVGFDRYGFGGADVRLYYNRNTLNSLLYPTKGTRIDALFKQNFYNRVIFRVEENDSSDYDNLNLVPAPFWKFYFNVDRYVPVSPKIIISPGFSLGLSSRDIIFTDYFFMGGYRYNLRNSHIPFVGLSLNEGLVNNYIKLKMSLTYEVLPNLYPSLIINWAATGDSAGKLFAGVVDYSSDYHYVGFGGGVTVKTLFGPLSFFMGSTAPDYSLKWYVNLGFTF